MGARGDTRKRRKLKSKLALRERECWLCLGYYGPLDLSLPYRHPLAVEIDEEIPFSKGGDPFDLSGTHLVHRFCNLKKGSKVLPCGAFSEGVEKCLGVGFGGGLEPEHAAGHGLGLRTGPGVQKPEPSREW